MCCQFLQLLYEHVLRLQIKMRNSAHGLRRSVSCAEGVLMPLPHIHCFEIFFVHFLLLIVGHHIPYGSVCLALQLILLK